MNNTNQTALFTVASLLEQGKQIDHVSSVISFTVLLMCIVILFIPYSFMLITGLLIISVGLIEKYYAARVSLDAKLFSYLAEDIEQLVKRITQLDNILVSLSLVKELKQPRSLESRQQGAIVLLKKQLLCCLIQIVIFTLAVIWTII